jgi:hypothetical protein
MLSLSSCNRADAKARAKVKAFLAVLDARDIDGIKEMLCEETLALPDIDEQIAGALDFFEGKVVSYGFSHPGGGGDSIEWGETIKLYRTPYIDDIKTDAGKTYKVGFHYYLIYKDNENKVGITNFSVRELVNGSYHDNVYEVGEYIG